MNGAIVSDAIVFSPDDVDLSRSPLRNGISAHTYVLGAFNPGLTTLPNGNLLLMVRVAEALREPVKNNEAYSIRWSTDGRFVTDAWPLSDVNMKDPRKFAIRSYEFPVYALTSLSWLLPVEMDPTGEHVLHIHYEKAISPKASNQEYGIEDPRISAIDGRYYMTTCCVSSERHSTMLYVSDDGLSYSCLGMILDHQNKDMLLFGGKIAGAYRALTRPLGECYFASAPDSEYHPGPAIHMASSPDLLHWKPFDRPFLRSRRHTSSNARIGGGTPPIRTSKGWLMLYHGVESLGNVGRYQTFWAMLDTVDPSKIIHLADSEPLLSSNNDLTKRIEDKIYLTDVVFTTGIAEHDDLYVVASGELDLACRITTLKKSFFINQLT